MTADVPGAAMTGPTIHTTLGDPPLFIRVRRYPWTQNVVRQPEGVGCGGASKRLNQPMMRVYRSP